MEKVKTQKDRDYLKEYFQVVLYDTLLDAAFLGYHGRILVDNIKKPSILFVDVGHTYYYYGDYISVNQEVILDFDKLMDLFRLRQLKLLATITKKFDQSSLGDWQKKYIKLCEEQFRNNRDFVDIPYKKIYQDILERQEK
ncbi:MAG: hypothetical protein ACVCEJ_03580 [Candidatus Izemoplasmataceae bacterium]